MYVYMIQLLIPFGLCATVGNKERAPLWNFTVWKGEAGQRQMSKWIFITAFHWIGAEEERTVRRGPLEGDSREC